MDGTGEVIKSSGNVFADLNLAEPATELAKAELAFAISRVIERNEWTQEEAAQQMKIDQPKVSAIVCGRLTGFSFDRLLQLLNRLDCSVDVTVRTSVSPADAGISVTFIQGDATRFAKSKASTG